MRLCFGDTVVSGDDKRLGTIDSVQLALENNEVLGIVIGKSDQLPQDTFIPVDMIQGHTNNELTLLVSSDTAKQMAGTGIFPPLEKGRPSTSQSGNVPSGTPETGGLPTVAHNQLSLTDRIEAKCIDGQAGRLSCVLTDQYTNAVTSYILGDLPDTTKQVVVPLAWVDQVSDTVVDLSCTKDQLMHLPEPTPGFYIPTEQPGEWEQPQG